MAKKSNNGFAKAMDILLVFLGILSILMVAIYFVYTGNRKGIFTSTTSTFATSVTDPATGEKLSPLAVSYHENYNNLGKEVVEFKIRCYSDIGKQSLYERGYQLIIDEENGNELWYYDTVYGMSFASGNRYDETNEEGQHKEFYLIDIDNELWALRLDGSYQTKTIDRWRTFGQGMLHLFTFSLAGSFENVYNVETHYYTMEELMLRIKEIVKSCSYGSGEYSMPLIDLGDFLHMYQIVDGKISENSIGFGTLENSYFSIDVKYDRRGLAYAGQSIFNSVANDSNYNVTGIDFNVNYWTSANVYNISESDFGYRYSSYENGCYYYLEADLIDELSRYPDLEIYVNFDVSNVENVLGFDYFCFNGLKLEKLTIESDVEQNFKLLNGSLNDTQIDTIYISNVTIQNESGLEVLYEVV